jgi:hypothetical protein
MPIIEFEATLFPPEEGYAKPPGLLLRMPPEASAQLPSRGMSMVSGTVGGAAYRGPVEPDGHGSHWLLVNEDLLSSAGLGEGDRVAARLDVLSQWPEPRIPADLQAILDADEPTLAVWRDITPAARWDWIRWIGAVKQEATRKKRVESIPSRMRAGKRRPCCFDRNQCTITVA